MSTHPALIRGELVLVCGLTISGGTDKTNTSPNRKGKGGRAHNKIVNSKHTLIEFW